MRDELRFNFQEYEIDSEFSGKPHAFTKAFWRGAEREFALSLVDGWIRFCEVEKLQSGQWNFVVGEQLSRSSREKDIDLIFLRGTFNSAISSHNVGRLFCFHSVENTKQWIFVNTEKCGHIKNNYPYTAFRVDTPLSIVEHSVHQWYDQIEKVIEDDESDLSFSLAWNTNQRQQILKMARLKNGTMVEMERVAQLLLEWTVLLNNKEAFEESETFWANFRLGNLEEPTVLLGIADYWEEEDYELSYSQTLIWEIFLRYFEPTIEMKLYEKYSAISSRTQPHIAFETQNRDLTAHEGLELRLELAEWLQGKVPNDQINSLLA